MKIAMLFVAMLAFAVWMSGCVSTPMPGSGPAKPAGSSPWSYDQLIADNITPAMRKAVPGSLCPAGAPNPESFWAALFRATAYAESAWKVDSVYVEKFPANNGAPQKSQGLMQISLDDASRGPHCKAINPTTILQAEPNLLCSIDIMDELIRAATKDTLRANLGRYWSSIRDSKVDTMMQDLLPKCFAAQDLKLDMMDPGEAK